jgi:hypothetical protein
MQIYSITVKIDVTMPDPIEAPEETEAAASFIRSAKLGKWPGGLPIGGRVVMVDVSGPVNRRPAKTPAGSSSTLGT